MSNLGRSCLVVLIAAAVAAPFVGWGAFQTLQIQIDDSTKWVSPSNPARRDYEQFTAHFENGDALIVSWVGCHLEDERLERLVTALRDVRQFCDDQGRPFFERVASGADSWRALCDAPVELEPDAAARRLRGTVVGFDGKTTAAFITFSKIGVANRMVAVEKIHHTVSSITNVPVDEQRYGGTIIDSYDVQHASNQSMRLFGPLSALVILLACRYCLKSWRVAWLVFLLSFYCEGLTLALVYFLGFPMSPLMIVMPPLVLVLGVSGGIHLVNYYFDALHLGEPRSAPHRAFRQGWLPCLLSAGTTAIGLISLLVSDLKPIRDFGLFAAIGVMLTLVVLLLVVPGMFELWPVRTAAEVSPRSTAPRFRMAQWLIHHHAVVTGVSFVAMGAALWGIPSIRTSVSIHTLFAEESRFIRDYRWLEEHVGPLVPIEVLVQFDPTCPLDLFDRLQFVKTVQAKMQQLDGVGGTMSAATFLPDVTLGRGLQAFFTKKIASRKLEAARARLTESRFLRDTTDQQQWRVTARISALSDVDYGDYLAVVRQQLEPLLAEHSEKGIRGLSFSVTGVMPVVHVMQRELLADLFSSFLSAFAVITVVMMCTERSVIAGLVAMIPNVFPMVLMFGWLGWLRVPLDIGTVMTASLALGMAIDGTLHYLTFFRRSLASGQSHAAAVQSAFDHCAPAMTESSVICGLGLLMFAFGSFLPTQRFAWMMVALIVTALAGDLIVLPALLAGPLGRFFRAV